MLHRASRHRARQFGAQHVESTTLCCRLPVMRPAPVASAAAFVRRKMASARSRAVSEWPASTVSAQSSFSA
jgi:hypothetical protein